MGIKTLGPLKYGLKSKLTVGQAHFDVQVTLPFDDRTDDTVVFGLKDWIDEHIRKVCEILDQEIDSCNKQTAAIRHEIDAKVATGFADKKEIEALVEKEYLLIEHTRELVRKGEANIKTEIPKHIQDYWDLRKADDAALRNSKLKAVATVIAAVVMTGVATVAAVFAGPPGWLAAIGLALAAVKNLKSIVGAIKGISINEGKLRAEISGQIVKVEDEVEEQGKAGTPGFADKIKKLFATNELKALAKMVENHRVKLIEMDRAVGSVAKGAENCLSTQDKCLKMLTMNSPEAHKYKAELESAEKALHAILTEIDHLNSVLATKRAFNNKVRAFVESIHAGKPVSGHGLADKGNELFERIEKLHKFVEGIEKIVEHCGK